MSRPKPLAVRATAELVGSALLLATVVGSGIMGEKLAGGNDAIALLANSTATGAGLVAILLALGGVSGAHLNPIVTITEAARGALPWRDVGPYALAQLAGAIGGVVLANVMFDLPAVTASTTARAGAGLWVAEVVATLGLLVVVRGAARHRPDAVPFAVGGYIAAAYWFTSSTSFANPAVTVARMLTDTFAGIAPADVPAFVAAQLGGGLVAIGVLRVLEREEEQA